MLLKWAIPSLNRCERSKDEIALSICDCHSDDVPDLEKKIRNLWKGKLYYINTKHGFNRSFAVNTAVDQCEQDHVFVSDADVALPEDLIDLMDMYVSA